MSRQDQYRVVMTVAYGGEVHDFLMDSMSGGEIDSDDTKFYPGGMQNQISLGGRRTVNNVTVSKLYDLISDHPLMGWLAGGAGKADVTVVKTSLTVDVVSVANPLVYRGKFKQLTPPEHDSESSDAAMWEVEVSSATVTQ